MFTWRVGPEIGNIIHICAPTRIKMHLGSSFREQLQVSGRDQAKEENIEVADEQNKDDALSISKCAQGDVVTQALGSNTSDCCPQFCI